MLSVEKKELKFHEEKWKYLESISEIISVDKQDYVKVEQYLDRYIKRYGPGGINWIELMSNNCKWMIRDLVNVYVPYISEWS